MSSKIVLVVDDSKFQRNSVMKKVEKLGYSTAEACDGLEAYEMIKNKVYDCVLTDIHMPELDGFGLVKKVREELGNKSLPILVISADVQDETYNHMLALGVTGFIQKPIKEDALVDALSKVLNK